MLSSSPSLFFELFFEPHSLGSLGRLIFENIRIEDDYEGMSLRSLEIIGSLADIRQLYFQDLGVLNQKLLAENLQNEPDRLLDVNQGLLFRFALAYGPRQFEAPDSITPLFLRFEDDCLLHRE